MIWSNPTSLTLRKGACFFDFVLSITPVPREGPTKPEILSHKKYTYLPRKFSKWGGVGDPTLAVQLY
jgi:hypothetical protein